MSDDDRTPREDAFYAMHGDDQPEPWRAGEIAKRLLWSVVVLALLLMFAVSLLQNGAMK